MGELDFELTSERSFLDPASVEIRSLREVSDVSLPIVVVDVLRAFSTSAWLLARGATRVVLAPDAESALLTARRIPGSISVSGGIDAARFDLANSPEAASVADVAGRTVVMKSSSGTVAVHALGRAELLLCASFVVAGATADTVIESGAGRCVIVPAGGLGSRSEDHACAEYLRDRLTSPDADAAPYLARALDSDGARDLAEGRRRGYFGIGPDDVRLSLEIDRFGFAMRVSSGPGDLLSLEPTQDERVTLEQAAAEP